MEELVCLATWKDGSTKYLVGKLYHKMATSDEDRYRCFVYEQHHQHNHHQIYQVAQSGDATCNGLPSATEGSRTMRLTTSKCISVHRTVLLIVVAAWSHVLRYTTLRCSDGQFQGGEEMFGLCMGSVSILNLGNY